MRLLNTMFSLLAAAAMAFTAGCSSSTDKPTEKPAVQNENNPQAQKPAEDDSPAAVSLATEFQQPPVVPSGDPLPKLTDELLANQADSATPATAPPETAPKVAAVNPPVASAGTVSSGATGSASAVPGATAVNPPPRKRPGKHNGEPFDPIKENGTIFDNWPKPKAALVLTGMEQGYIEPCGCSGLDRMKGGMRRRYAMIERLRQDGWPVVPMDVGGIAHGFGLQAEMKFRMLVESKEKMGYKAVGFGPDDLRLPAAGLVSVAAAVNNKPSMFLSANVGLFSFDAHITETSRVLVAGGRKIGVTAVLGIQYQKEINNSDLQMIDPAAALQKIVPELKQKADYLVLLAHATRKEAIELAQKFPAFNAIVVAEGPDTPPADPDKVPNGQTLLITVGHKGMDAIVLGLYDDPQQPYRYQRVPLDSRFDPPANMKNPPHEMKDLMAAYQEQVKAVGFAGLVQPSPHPQAETNGKFVGSQQCESCHEPAYRVWKKSMHAHAYETLEKLDPARNFDPECVSCHVVGWHPSKNFPYAGGFEDMKKTPHLAGVGCENCHGPGEKHVAAEMPGGNVELRDKYRKAVRITKEESKKRQCITCHDGDNSRDFNFDTYWPLIEHKTKEEE